MAIKTYVGARYAPNYKGAWVKTNAYAALDVVYTNNTSYVARQAVPANTAITNTKYWIKSADWNAQVEQYNANVEKYNTNVETYNKNVTQYNKDVNTFFQDSIHVYDTQAQMVADTKIKVGYTLITCGKSAIGDGLGSLYEVVSTTSSTAVALKNGLFAVPFNFTLESGVGQYTGQKDDSTGFVQAKPVMCFGIADTDNRNINIVFPAEIGRSFTINVASHTEFIFNYRISGSGVGNVTSIYPSEVTALNVRVTGTILLPYLEIHVVATNRFIETRTPVLPIDTPSNNFGPIEVVNAATARNIYTGISGNTESKMYIIRNSGASLNLNFTFLPNALHGETVTGKVVQVGALKTKLVVVGGVRDSDASTLTLSARSVELTTE